jgi:hypothetical protein
MWIYTYEYRYTSMCIYIYVYVIMIDFLRYSPATDQSCTYLHANLYRYLDTLFVYICKIAFICIFMYILSVCNLCIDQSCTWICINVSVHYLYIWVSLYQSVFTSIYLISYWCCLFIFHLYVASIVSFVPFLYLCLLWLVFILHMKIGFWFLLCNSI